MRTAPHFATDTRGSSANEYLVIAALVGVAGIAGISQLGGAHESAIAGGAEGGVPAVPSAMAAAGEGGPGGAEGGGAGGGTGSDARGAGGPVTVSPLVLAAGAGGGAGGDGRDDGSDGPAGGGGGGSGGGSGGGNGGGGFRVGPFRIGGSEGSGVSFGPLHFDAPGGVTRALALGATGPFRAADSLFGGAGTRFLGAGVNLLAASSGGGSCWNPLNVPGCAADAIFGEDEPPPPVKAGDLPAPDADDFRVLTINAANGHECKNEDGEGNELADECGGNPDYYRTRENRDRLGEIASESGADVVALQEIDVGNGRSDKLDTGLRTAAQTHPSLSIFLTGDPGTDYEVVGIDEECSRLPCKKISPDGTVVYLTEDGSYVGGASICSQGADNRCPRGTTEDPHFGSWDVADNEGYGDQVHIPGDGDKSCPADPNVVGDEHRRYGTGTVIGPDQQVTDAYTVVLPNGHEDRAPPIGDRDALHDYNNAERLDYADLPGSTDDVDKEPRTALVTVVTAPDGTERVVINVHLARKGDDVQRAQLEGIAEIVAAEAARGRDVVVTGDFNMDQEEVGRVFDGAGLTHASGSGIDMTWVEDGIRTETNHDIDSDGASDHELGATTTID